MAGTRETVFTHAQIVLPDAVLDGSLVVRDGQIHDISAGPLTPSAEASAIDCDGDLLLPGLIELHTDHLERHLMPRPGVFWPAFSALQAHDAQAASAGITTVFDAVALGDRDGREERLQYLDEAFRTIESAQSPAGEDAAAMASLIQTDFLKAEHFLHLRCEVPKQQVCDLFDQYAKGQRVRLISLMDHTPGDRQFPDVARLKEYAVTHDGEAPDAFDARIALEQANQKRYAAPNRRALADAAAAKGLVIASHDDASQAHIDEARELGVTISEFPTTLEAARAARKAGMTTIMGAPNVIRGGSHSGNVAAIEMARHDLLDALSSDYVPISLIHAPFQIAEKLDWPLPKALALVTANPARMGGLDDRGALRPGLRADLIRVHRGEGQIVVREAWRCGRRVA